MYVKDFTQVRRTCVVFELSTMTEF